MSYTPVAVVTGNHNFDVPGFQRMLDSIPESVCYLQDLDNFVADLGQFNDRYRTVVFYNFHQLTPVASDRLGASTIDAIDRLSENGQGLLILHHAILAFPKWEVWNRIVGISDRSFGYDPDQVVQTDISLADHPITSGLQSWQMVDETYSMNDAGGDSQVILSTDHPKSMQVLGWTRQYKNSRVFCYQSGHDNQVFADDNFRRVMAQGIDWLTEPGKQKFPRARDI